MFQMNKGEGAPLCSGWGRGALSLALHCGDHEIPEAHAAYRGYRFGASKEGIRQIG
ncbi:MAG TPA: hypothetical protein VHC72_21335 [Bryobacteraceae bacterium]|nr:hypothetical protein [Bryobacteraceae bacterium]